LQVKNIGRKIGFVINPETPVTSLFPYLRDLDQILIMTVKPGFYGSPFLPEMLSKITLLHTKEPTLNIEVDGGITDKTISLVNSAGANMFVSGSYIVKADDVPAAIETLKKLVE